MNATISKQSNSDQEILENTIKSDSGNLKNEPSELYVGARKLLPGEDPYSTQSHPADRLTHMWLGKWAPVVSHISILMAFFDWMVHFSIHPYQFVRSNQSILQKIVAFEEYMRQSIFSKNKEKSAISKLDDHRFKGELWQDWPYNWYHKAFLLIEDWWDELTSYVPGVTRHHLDIVNFTTRQFIDAFSPSIVPAMNPYVWKKAQETGGINFLKGVNNFMDDYLRWIRGNPPEGTERFIPGKQVAVTPGKVIFRNELIELIQYQAQTEKVYSEPVLIVPAWIMKFYILDLSPHNSLVRYLVENGHTVFMISWKNPDSNDRDLSLNDYLKLGVLDALKIIQKVLPESKIHAAGYCLGGTLLMMAAAFLAKQNNDILGTITNFATQIDFEEAGELMLFIDESQLDYIEDNMWEQGYLDGYQMAGAFYLLRSNDLIWSRIIHEYQMGERKPLNDLMAWNADATRMPFRMHSEYLRRLFLNNELSEGRYEVNEETIALTDIKAPIFSVSTVTDHVAPWKSVYKIHLYSDTEVTFILTTGGHNAGIISEIGHEGRSYQIKTSQVTDSYVSPSSWLESVPHKDGSWWPEWLKWLSNHSGKMIIPPKMGVTDIPIVGDAPGTYVMKH